VRPAPGSGRRALWLAALLWTTPLGPALAADPAPGAAHTSADVGKLLYARMGCSGCHRIQGEGSAVGPDLSNAGNVAGHDRDWQVRHLMDPAAVVPGSFMPKLVQTEGEAGALADYLLTLKAAPEPSAPVAAGPTADPEGHEPPPAPGPAHAPVARSGPPASPKTRPVAAPAPEPKAVPAPAAKAPEAPFRPAQARPSGPAPTEGLGAAWVQVRRTAEGAPSDFEAAVTALLGVREVEGLDNLETAGVALADWAGQAVVRGDAAAAERLSRAAVRVAPGAPEGYLVRARMYWSEGRPAAAAGWTARAAAAGLSHYWVGLAWLGYAVIVLWLAAATALAVLLAPGVVRGARTFHHLLREYAAFRVASAWVLLGCLAVLALPLAAGWGLGWTVVLWAAVAWVGDPAPARRAQVLLLLTVLLGPWLCAPLMAPAKPPQGPVELALLEGRGALAAADRPAPGDVPVAQDGWRVAFAFGNAALRGGAYDEAIAWYREAQAAGGDPVRLSHNIATAAFRAGRYEEAERRFKELAEGGTAPGRTWFNLGQAQSRRLDFDSARASFERARQADADLYVRVARTAGEQDDFFVVPFGMSNRDARAILLANGSGWGELAGPLWGFLFAGLAPWAAPLLLVAAGGLAWMLPRVLVGWRVYPCDVCRGSVCRECMQFVYDVHLCRACALRLGETRGTASDIAIMRDRHRRLGTPAGRLARRLVPGLYDMARGRHGRASLHLMALAFVAWGAVLLGTIPSWAVSTPLAGWPVARLAGTLVVLAHVAGNWVIVSRHEPVPGRVDRKQAKDV